MDLYLKVGEAQTLHTDDQGQPIAHPVVLTRGKSGDLRIHIAGAELSGRVWAVELAAADAANKALLNFATEMVDGGIIADLGECDSESLATAIGFADFLRGLLVVSGIPVGESVPDVVAILPCVVLNRPGLDVPPPADPALYYTRQQVEARFYAALAAINEAMDGASASAKAKAAEAAASATSAEQSADAAAASATSAEQSANATATSAAAASASATFAEQGASAAAASATSAAVSSTSAATSADEAAASATSAEQSANAAAASADSASASATSAEQGTSAAAASAASAAVSSTSAATSANAAAASADSASASATSAEQSANAAATSESNAATNRHVAEQSANAAVASATAAADDATAAGQSASAAAASATDASASATSAEQSANAAAASATAAEEGSRLAISAGGLVVANVAVSPLAYSTTTGYYADLTNPGDAFRLVYNVSGCVRMGLLARSANAEVAGRIAVKITIGGTTVAMSYFAVGSSLAWHHIDLDGTFSGAVEVELVSGLTDGDDAVTVLVQGASVSVGSPGAIDGYQCRQVAAKPLLYSSADGYYYLLDDTYDELALLYPVTGLTTLALKLRSANSAIAGTIAVELAVGETTVSAVLSCSTEATWQVIALPSAASGTVTLARDTTSADDTLADGSDTVSAVIDDVIYYWED